MSAKPSRGSDGTAADPAPWPAWVRYLLLSLLFAVIGIGLVVALYDRGVLPIAGPFVVLALAPLLLPLRRRGQRARARRLASRLDEQLGDLARALGEERALEASQRRSGASDEVLSETLARVAHAGGLLRSDRWLDASRSVEDLAPGDGRLLADAPRAAALAAKVSDVVRTGRELGRALDHGGSSAR